MTDTTLSTVAGNLTAQGYTGPDGTNTSFADLDLDFTAWRHRRARRHVRRLRQSVMWDVFRRQIDHINR